MKLTYLLDKAPHTLNVDRAGDTFTIEQNDGVSQVQLVSFVPPRLTFSLQGKIITARVATDGKKRWVHVHGATFVLERQEAIARHVHHHGSREGTGSGIVVAPMPGQVRAVMVNAGDTVAEGQPLLVLEAMKMELQVSSPHDGTVAKIHVTPGQTVERDQVLGEITETESE